MARTIDSPAVRPLKRRVRASREYVLRMSRFVATAEVADRVRLGWKVAMIHLGEGKGPVAAL
jgi:hypothetical protein